MKFQKVIKKQILKWRLAYAISFSINFAVEILMIAFGFFVVLSLFDSVFYFQARVRQALFIILSFSILYKILKSAKVFFYYLKLDNFSVLLAAKKPILSKYIGPAISFILKPEYKSKDVSEFFVEEHLSQTAVKIKNSKTIKFSPFDFKNFNSKLVAGISLALCFAAIWLINPLSAQRMLLPFLASEFESMLTISPQNAVIVENESVLIKVAWEKNLSLVPVLQIKEKDSGWVSVNWDNKNLFDCQYHIQHLKNDIRYRLKYRSMKSLEYLLKVRYYPQIKDLNFTVKRPVYLKGEKNIYSYIPAQTAILQGSEILIKAEASKGASKIILYMKSASNDRKINFLKDKNGNFHMAFKVYEAMSLEFEIFADDGLINSRKIFQELNIIKDLPPVADILSPLFEVEMPSGGGIKIIYQAKDDFGLSKISLRSEIRFKGRVAEEYNSLKKLKIFEAMPGAVTRTMSIKAAEAMPGAVLGGYGHQAARGKNIKEFIGETYVFFPNFIEDFDMYFYLRVFDAFPGHRGDLRWTESLPVKVKIKNFYKNHIEALRKLSEVKNSFLQMLKIEEKAAGTLSQISGSFRTSDFLKRWEKLKKLSEKAFASLNQDPYFNAGLKNEYEMLQEDIDYMARVRAQKAVQEFKGQYYKKAAATQKSMTSFLKRGLLKMDDILNSQTAKDFEFKAEDWENSLSKIDKALFQGTQGKVDKELWNDLSEIMENLALEMNSMRKMLSRQKYKDSFGKKKRFQIPMNKASGLADKLQEALKNRNLKEALAVAKALLEEIKKTRQVFGEYSEFVASMQGNDKKIKKLQKIKDLWRELRDKQEETFSKNTVFMDDIVPEINRKKESVIWQLSKSFIKIKKMGLKPEIRNMKGLKFNSALSFNKVKDIIVWRNTLKSNLDILKKTILTEENIDKQSLMAEMNFSINLSSAIENDVTFYDLKDKTFFIASGNNQGRLISDANKLEIDLDNVKEEFLKFSIKAQKHISKAIDEMKSAVLALKAYDMNKALVHQIKALEELDALGDMINKNMQKQKKMSSAKKNGAGGPKSFEMPAGGGSGRLDKSGVKLPKEGSSRPSKEIREKVMESLKESYPQKSKKTILDYLRKISE